MKPGNKGMMIRQAVIVLALVISALVFSLGISKDKPVGTITGKVYDSKSGNPIEGAKVYRPDRNTYVKTDKYGVYTIYGVPENDKPHTLRVYAKGFKYSYYPGVKVNEGKVTGNIDFKMVRRQSHYSIYAYQKVFSPKENPTVTISGYLVKKINLKIYKIDARANIDYLTDYSKLQKINVEDKIPVKEIIYTSKLDDDGDFHDTYQLPIKPNGVYIIKAKAVNGSLENTTWVMKSDMGLIVKRSSSDLLVYAQSFTTKKPIPGAQLKLYVDKNFLKDAKTGKDGTFFYKHYQTKPFRVVAQEGDNFAFANTYYSYVPERQKTFLYTDRPVYRPGQRVFFKGINRYREGFRYAIYPGTPVDVTVSDSRGNRILSKRYYTGRNGSFNGSIKLEEEAPLGSYYINTKIGSGHGSCYFEVSEYKKPEYKVEVATDRPHYVAGDKIKVKVLGKYYFGAPVSNAKYSITVMESAYRWRYWDDYNVNREFHGGIMFEKDGKLDAEGEAEIIIPTGKIENDRMLRIQVEVTDLSGRAVTDEISAPLSVGEFALYGHTDKYVYEPQEEVTLEVEARDYEEKPVVKQPVSVKVSRVTYEEIKEEKTRRVNGRRTKYYEYHTKRIETPVGGIKTVTTDAKGDAKITFTPKEEGSYVMTLYSKDGRGNKIIYKAYAYVASESYDGMMAEADVKIITDKKKYKRGDTVKAVITTSEKDSYVLMTLEGRRIYEKKVLFIKGSSKTLDIPLKDEYFPNVFLSVATIKDMDLLQTVENITMDQSEKKLNITITPDKKRYYPGDKARYTVEVKDWKGKPVEAEFSLGVVDEAIYAIKPDTTPDIHNFFWKYDYNHVSTVFSFSRSYSGGADKDRPDTIRKNFKDTAFWAPAVVTGRDGKGIVEFYMPDNLTTWVTTVRAVSTNTDAGSDVNFVVSTKDLLVRLETPRFITQRDKIYIGGVVHNYTKKTQKVKVWLEAEGVELLDKEKAHDSLKPEEAKDFYWEVAAKEPGEAKFTLLCVGTDADDAMELKVPVQAFGVEEVTAKSGIIGKDENTANVEMNLPDNVIPQVTNMEILLSPSIASSMLENLDYLIHYPYGCVEQTMSSFYPALTASRVLKHLNIRETDLTRQIPKIVKKGLGKLYDMQHYDGGWGWWQHDKTVPYMTAYVVQGLKEAQKNGYDVSKYRLKRGIDVLTKMIKEKPGPTTTFGGAVIQGEEWNARIYVLYSLYKTGMIFKDKTLEVYENRSKLNDYGLALLAMNLDGAGETDKAREVMTELDAKAQDDGKDCYWDGRTFTYSWMDNKIESTAYCLMAYVQIKPNDERVHRIINWLSKQRRGRSYLSTKDTAAVVYAFTGYLLKSGEANPDYNMLLKVNGDTYADFRVNDIKLPEHVSDIKIDYDKLKKGNNTIKLGKMGTGNLYWTVRLRYFKNEPKIAPMSNGLTVSRKYSLITRKKDKRGRVNEILEPLPLRPLKRGEKLRVEVTVKPDRDYQYVIIEDPLPAGFEVTIPQGERNWGSLWWCQQEIRDEKVSFFSRRLTKGKEMKLSYDIRSEMFGRVNVLPALAYAMYEPEIRGHSSSQNLSVETGKK